ncbi:MAG: sigma-54-dependent Fis family transcriptional regulator [Bacteroidetes bacterium]|nr:MAG: sigma-54-dependent Fis family transcriptional regulator [Bacteroidota bacterium]
MDLQTIKQRFGIIGNSPALNRAIEIAVQVAPTDLTVFITGESGSGKESFPKIIHQLGSRKHGNYIAVNCGAIPEGTIDSELFGHEKGSFTGASDSRKGYFEVANGGTIFLDEVAELPLSTQVRLLRVLENGEFMRVGSSKVFKTDVRVVAATNVDVPNAIEEGKFREDLYYRLNTVPIKVPPLRERKEDIVLLFRKFASDFADKYRMPTLQLTEDAKQIIMAYPWKGNVRQLKNITEQISIIEKDRVITPDILRKYLPEDKAMNKLPVLYRDQKDSHLSERDLLYKVLFEMRQDVTDLKKLVREIMKDEQMSSVLRSTNARIIRDLDNDLETAMPLESIPSPTTYQPVASEVQNAFIAKPNEFEAVPIQESEVVEESLSLQEKEIELIKRALKKHNGKRKNAAQELGISERTLYRKIKEHKIS